MTGPLPAAGEQRRDVYTWMCGLTDLIHDGYTPDRAELWAVLEIAWAGFGGAPEENLTRMWRALPMHHPEEIA